MESVHIIFLFYSIVTPQRVLEIEGRKNNVNTIALLDPGFFLVFLAAISSSRSDAVRASVQGTF